MIFRITRVISRYGSFPFTAIYLFGNAPLANNENGIGSVAEAFLSTIGVADVKKNVWGGKFGFGGHEPSVSNISAPHFGQNNFRTNAWVIGFRHTEAAAPTKENNIYRQLGAIFHLFKGSNTDEHPPESLSQQ